MSTTKYIHSTSKVDATTKKLQMENTIIDCSTDASADGNVVKNIGVDNFLRMATDGSDAKKVFRVNAATSGTDAGTWEVVTMEQYLKVDTFAESGALKAGNTETLYYHDAEETIGTKAYSKGMFIWDSTSSDYIACSITSNVDVDGDTITKDSVTNALKLQTGNATKGVKTTHINTASLTTSADIFPEATAAVDTKLITEKVAATELEKRVKFDDASTVKTFTVGVDTDGHYYFLTP